MCWCDTSKRTVCKIDRQQSLWIETRSRFPVLGYLSLGNAIARDTGGSCSQNGRVLHVIYILFRRTVFRRIWYLDGPRSPLFLFLYSGRLDTAWSRSHRRQPNSRPHRRHHRESNVSGSSSQQPHNISHFHHPRPHARLTHQMFPTVTTPQRQGHRSTWGILMASR